MIKAILACDSQGGIGREGALPWPPNKKDLAHFQKLTSGCTVVMGRGTWEGKGMPKPLPKRRNVVVTSDSDYSAHGAEVVTDIKSNLTKLAESNTVFVIGGAILFEHLIDDIQILHLTRIAGHYNCDAILPMDLIEEKFVKIDSVDVDVRTTFDTYFARKLHDLSINTNFG